MATATLTDGPAVQLTFPWALPKAEEESIIVAERGSQSAARKRGRASRPSSSAVGVRVTIERHATQANFAPQPSIAVQSSIAVEPSIAPAVVAVAVPATECAASVQEALSNDRIGKPIRIGAVMFRLLKRYGITDEEIAEGIAAYTAKRNAALA